MADPVAGHGGATICQECGSVGSVEECHGVQVCQSCGAVCSFVSETREEEGNIIAQQMRDRHAVLRYGGAPSQKRLVGITATSRQWAECREMDRRQVLRDCRLERCQKAVKGLSMAMRLQESVQMPTVSLLARYTQRVGRVPVKGEKLKRLVSACILVIATRMELGVGMREVARSAGLQAHDVSKSLWKVCKVCGLRLRRTLGNTEAMMHRLCDHLQVGQHRGPVVALATRLVRIAEDGWVTTGRMWAHVVAGALVLAAQVYHSHITTEAAAEMLAISPHVVLARIGELRKALVSLTRALPWGQAVTVRNVHAFTLFAVEYYSELRVLAADSRQRELDDRQAADLAAGPPGAVAGAGGPPAGEAFCAAANQDRGGTDDYDLLRGAGWARQAAGLAAEPLGAIAGAE